jgi:thiamine-phosphate pyrophosphorylase
MTDAVRLPDPVPAILRLPPCSAVVLRERDPGKRAVRARQLLPLCRRRKVRLLIAGDWRLVRAIGADGLHLSETLIRRGRRDWCRALAPDRIVTAAAHSRRAMRLAARCGVDAVLLSPVFPTASHPHATVLGPLRFARWVRESPIPVYALGGIDAARARRLRGVSLAGFAAIGALAGSDQPR